jgi:predicted amidohydrolase
VNRPNSSLTNPGSAAALSAPRSCLAAGRPVRAVSIGFSPGLSVDEVAALVDGEAACGADIVALPETFRGQNSGSTESLDGTSVRALARLARKHRTYIVCPIDRTEGDRRFNSAVLLDRSGEIVCVYDKVHPLCHVEGRKDPAVCPGENIAVCATDFGRVGLAICFDVNWPDLWRRMADQDAELVIWPSAYSAGIALQAHAIQNHYYIMSATWGAECAVFDIDGERIAFDRNNRGGGVNVTRATLDLDRCIFHFDLNDAGPLSSLLQDHGDHVMEEKRLPLEAWFILKAQCPGFSARELAARYGLEELRNYLARCGHEIDQRRADTTPSAALAAAGTAPG